MELRIHVKEAAQQRARTQRAESEIESLVAENTSLTQRLGVLRKRNETLERESARAKGAAALMEVVEAERGSMEAAQQRSGDRLEALHVRIRDLEKALHEAAEGLIQARASQASAPYYQPQDISSYREALAVARKEVLEAREEAAEARRRSAVLEGQNALASRAGEHAAEAATLREQLALCHAALDAMKDEREAWDERVAAAEARGRREAAAELNSLRATLLAIDKSVAHLEAEQRAVGDTVKALRTERGSLERLITPQN